MALQVCADGLAHCVQDLVKVRIRQAEAKEQHVLGDQHRLHDATDGLALVVVIQIVLPCNDNGLGFSDAAVHLEKPSRRAVNGLKRQDRKWWKFAMH